MPSRKLNAWVWSSGECSELEISYFQGDSVLTWIHKIVVDHKSCTHLRSYYEEWIGRLGQGLGADL